MVQLFVNETYVMKEWYDFQDYLWERVAIPVIQNKVMKRNTFSIVASDGVKYAHWIRNAGLETDSLPACFLIDFVDERSWNDTQKSGVKYAIRSQPTMETLDSDLYQFINEYSLGLLPPLVAKNTDEEEL